MLIIGLTGGIASGKSAVAKELAALGTVVLNADEAAHRVINYPEVRLALSQRWGPKVLQPDGSIDRRAVAERVFGPTSESRSNLEYLESVLHPRIRAEFVAELEGLRASNTAAAVIDAPLLLEAGWDEICDSVIFVDSPREVCKLRAQMLRNWTADEFAAREAAQMPIEEKRRRATHVIANNGTLDELRSRVRELWTCLPIS
jgi:dephospho-CoA kinase